MNAFLINLSISVILLSSFVANIVGGYLTAVIYFSSLVTLFAARYFTFSGLNKSLAISPSYGLFFVLVSILFLVIDGLRFSNSFASLSLALIIVTAFLLANLVRKSLPSVNFTLLILFFIASANLLIVLLQIFLSPTLFGLLNITSNDFLFLDHRLKTYEYSLEWLRATAPFFFTQALALWSFGIFMLSHCLLSYRYSFLQSPPSRFIFLFKAIPWITLLILLFTGSKLFIVCLFYQLFVYIAPSLRSRRLYRYLFAFLICLLLAFPFAFDTFSFYIPPSLINSFIESNSYNRLLVNTFDSESYRLSIFLDHLNNLPLFPPGSAYFDQVGVDSESILFTLASVGSFPIPILLIYLISKIRPSFSYRIPVLRIILSFSFLFSFFSGEAYASYASLPSWISIFLISSYV